MKTKTLFTLLALGGATCLQSAETRIVGGTNTTAGAYPFMTALVEKGASPSNGQFCGAALVAPQWVLTAGHCMEGTPASSVEVWIGGRDLRNTAEGVRVAVSQVIMHPNYGENSQGALVYDFCLLKLARAVTERSTLPLVETSAQVAAGITSRAVGWGATSEGGSGSQILRQVDLPLVSLAIAGQTVPGLGASHLAAGRVSGGIDTCQGDSGGPLLVKNAAGQWLHGGTVSFGNGCARPGEYGIYGNTISVKSWLQNYIGGGGTTPTDDHSNTTTNASTLAINGSATGQLEVGSDKDVFRVQALNAGTLVITSSGSTDVVGELLNSAGTLLSSDDNGAGGVNFRLTRTLTAGATFFVRVSGKTASTTGGYGVSAVLTSAPTNGEIDVMNGTVALAHNASSLDYGTRTVNGTALTKTITIYNRGQGALAINSASISPAGSFTVNTQPAKSLAAGGKTSFIVGFKAQQSGPISATLSISNNDTDENPYLVTLTGAGEGGSTSGDHGNTLATASVVAFPSTTPASIASGTDVDVFKFTLTSSRSVTLKTTGALDTYGTLYNGSGAYLTEADDTTTDYNFRITRTLAAGTYYLVVEGYDASEIGAYSLVIQ